MEKIMQPVTLTLFWAVAGTSKMTLALEPRKGLAEGLVHVGSGGVLAA